MSAPDYVIDRVPGSIRAAIAGRGGPLTVLHQVDHPDGMVYAYAGAGPLSYAGQNWAGVGDLAGISGLGFSRKTIVRTPVITLGGVSADQLKFVSAKVRGRRAVISLAALRAGRKEVDGDIFNLCVATCDSQVYSIDNSRTATVAIALVQPVFVMDRAPNLRWTPEWFKATFGQQISGADDMPNVAGRVVNFP